MLRLPKPFCEFCRTDGQFDYNEHHAIMCGFGFPLWLWPFIICRNAGPANDLWLSEPWYIAFGMLLRVALGIAVVKGVL